MHISKNLSVLTFLMLVLIQTAISGPVPVENNNKLKDDKLEIDNVLYNMNPVEINKRFTELLEKLFNKKFVDVAPSTFDINTVETYKNLTNLLKNLVKQESTEVKVKVDDFLKRILPVETKKKLNDLLEELSNQNLQEAYKKMVERLTNMLTENLTNIKVKADDFLAQMKLAEQKQKIKEFFVEWSNNHVAETVEELKWRLTNLLKEELLDVKIKIDDFLNYINSAEVNNYLNDLLAKLSNKDLADTFKNSADQLRILVKEELTYVKAMIANFLRQPKRANGKPN